MLEILTENERRELIKGLEEHNSGKYFACHETIEDIWMDKGGDLRRFLQGLIHVAVGFYHLRDSNYVGAYRQLEKANRKLSDYAAVEVGINLPEMLLSLKEWLKNVRFLLDNPDSDKNFGTFPKFDYNAEKILGLT
ncbi:DUF309 domain-containing protein [Candidatus Marinimicrobia bacterium MT.SAG.3]|nr:DUF309 domain-containing protein [Candidatus Neomarinimicrobiota bacterium]MCH8300819.1 DUF309 domain-containing protein [Candidatus Neomarinimicrobiota bacterium]MCH8303998.1 DUF309 domain-containing protein [Candidatus Neomarinimicrobiota bacterium]TFB10125.1 DUF309 domain-containing protein [Candidatus Marinimicrobia bacterium MT.SAG.4]TFB12379.1 DUF309 domain-containing protein [Candidatus Marinimicrobia bacterium MT.SAG.3]